MSTTAPDNSALKSLELALTTDALPVHARKAGQRLLDRLKSPVCCVILGLKSSGKSKLLNLLAGRDIIPEDFKLPIVELSWAETSRTTFTKDDTGSVVLEGDILDATSVGAVKSVRIETDLPILKSVSFIEVGLNGSDAENADAVDWACSRADLVLWCTQEFSSREHDLWTKVPDALKDHSFLVIAKADLLMAQGTLTKRIQSAQESAADDFHSIFPVATLQAIQAIERDAKTEDPALAASGGKALIAEVMRQVQHGRSADMDSVLVFLNRHGSKSLGKQKAAGAVASHSLKSDIPDKVIDETAAVPGPSSSELASAALDYLKRRASGLKKIAAASSTPDPSQVLKYCGETANGLADIVAEQDTSDPALAEFQVEILDAAELLLLMEMEAGNGPAADAVTVLLQVRRGLEYRLAA